MIARSLLRWPLASVALVSLGACLDTPTQTNQQPTDYAVVNGTVSDPTTNAAVGGALIGVRIPVNRNPAAYVAPTSQSTDAGVFQLGVYRMDSTVVRTVPDTMTVWVIGTIPGLPAQGHTDSAQTTLLFSPIDQSAQPVQVSLKLSQ